MKNKIIVNPFIIFLNRFRVINPFRRDIVRFTKTDNPNAFFIIGSGRSGTTLLRSMLTQHDKVEIPPESYVLPIIYKRYRVYRKLPWLDFYKIILGEFIAHPLFKYWHVDTTPLFNQLNLVEANEQSLYKVIDSLYRLYAAKHGKTNIIWGDKTPLNTEYVKELDYLFNNPKYINLKRDGRDVVASMLKNDLSGGLKQACDRWLKAIQIGEEIKKKHPERIIDIEYSALVENPNDVLVNICEFLGITFQSEMLDHTKNIDTLGDSQFEHHINLKKPLSNSSIGSWKSYFSNEDKNWIDNYMGETLRQQGY